MSNFITSIREKIKKKRGLKVLLWVLIVLFLIFAFGNTKSVKAGPLDEMGYTNYVENKWNMAVYQNQPYYYTDTIQRGTINKFILYLTGNPYSNVSYVNSYVQLCKIDVVEVCQTFHFDDLSIVFGEYVTIDLQGLYPTATYLRIAIYGTGHIQASPYTVLNYFQTNQKLFRYDEFSYELITTAKEQYDIGLAKGLADGYADGYKEGRASIEGGNDILQLPGGILGALSNFFHYLLDIPVFSGITLGTILSSFIIIIVGVILLKVFI